MGSECGSKPETWRKIKESGVNDYGRVQKYGYCSRGRPGEKNAQQNTEAVYGA